MVERLLDKLLGEDDDAHEVTNTPNNTKQHLKQ